jgi:hypothetical protein
VIVSATAAKTTYVSLPNLGLALRLGNIEGGVRGGCHTARKRH